MAKRVQKKYGAGIDGQAFRALLRDELVRRCKVNPRYSLRAFARFLGVEPSALSKIIAGKRQVTSLTFKTFCARLALDPAQIRGFLKKTEARQGARAYDDASARLSLDAFTVVAEWYHLAILELVGVRGFKSESAWIARALGITAAESADAVDRLLRLGLLKRGPRGRLLSGSDETTTIGAADTAAALRKMQRQVLELRIRALEDTPVADRDQSTMTMAVNLARLPEAKERLNVFCRELCHFLEGGTPLDEVFHLSLTLYPVSNVRALRAAASAATARRNGAKEVKLTY